MSNAFHFYFPIRVRYSEADTLGYVFNSHFLEYCDVATTEYFRSAGVPPDDFVTEQYYFVMIHAELDFVTPARADDVLHAHVRTTAVGRSSLTHQVEFRHARDQSVVCRVLLKYVNVDRATGRSAPVPERLRGAIAQLDGKPGDA